MTLNHNCGCFSTVAGIAGNGLQLYVRFCFSQNLCIGAVMLSLRFF